MKYKKILAVVISLVLIWLLPIAAAAAKEPTVYAGTVNAKPGDAVFIPIQIKDNPGLMGFRLALSYDPGVLAPRAVSRGSVTQSGMFEDGIVSGKDTSFDIVWNNTEQTNENGTLAIIGFTCFDKAKDSTEIKIAYKQEDTFNEKYEDVKLRCESIKLDFSESAEPIAREDKREVTSEDIVLAVETVQGDPQITPTTAVMDSVNALLSQLTGDPKSYFNSPGEITDSYKTAVTETFVESVLDSVEVTKVQEIIQDALNLVGAASVESIPEDRRADFIRSIESALKDQAPDVKELSDYVSQADELTALSQLMDQVTGEAEENNAPNDEMSTSISQKTVVCIVCAAVAALLIALAVLLILKKRKKKAKKDKQKK